jgi:hypothetical protein
MISRHRWKEELCCEMDEGRCRKIGNHDKMIGTCSQKQEDCKGTGHERKRGTCFKKKEGFHQTWVDHQDCPVTTDDMGTSWYVQAVARTFSANANLSRSDDCSSRPSNVDLHESVLVLPPGAYEGECQGPCYDLESVVVGWLFCASGYYKI